MLSFYFHPANARMFIPMILVLINAHPEARAALLDPCRRFATVGLDQASNIANASAFGNYPRLSVNPRCQLRNSRCPLCNSLVFPSNTSVAPGSTDHQVIGIQDKHYRVRGARERRYVLPASTISSKSGSSLNRPASCSHQGRRAAFRTDFN